MNKPREGWGFPLRARRAHYFVNGRSLCYAWLYGGPVENSNHNSPDNCKTCMFKREAREKAVDRE